MCHFLILELVPCRQCEGGQEGEISAMNVSIMTPERAKSVSSASAMGRGKLILLY